MILSYIGPCDKVQLTVQESLVTCLFLLWTLLFLFVIRSPYASLGMYNCGQCLPSSPCVHTALDEQRT